MKPFTALALCLILSGCMSTKVVLDPKWNPSVKPSYTDYLDSYWFGLFGDSTVSLSRVCIDQKPYAFARSKTFSDTFFTLFSLGIYVPSTVRVWCGD